MGIPQIGQWRSTIAKSTNKPALFGLFGGYSLPQKGASESDRRDEMALETFVHRQKSLDMLTITGIFPQKWCFGQG